MLHEGGQRSSQFPIGTRKVVQLELYGQKSIGPLIFSGTGLQLQRGQLRLEAVQRLGAVVDLDEDDSGSLR